MIQSFLITVFWHDLHQGNILLSTPTTLILIFYPLSLFEFRLGLNWAGSKKAVYKLRCNNRSPSTWKLFAIRKSIPNLFQCKRTALDARRITQVNFCWLYAADLSEPLTPFRSPSNVLLPQLCGQLLTPYWSIFQSQIFPLLTKVFSPQNPTKTYDPDSDKNETFLSSIQQ